MKTLYTFCAVIGLGMLLLSCDHKPGLDNYRWILGDWEVQGKDTTTYESWNAINDTLFEGYNFSVHDKDTMMREHLWMESRDNKVILSAKVFNHNHDRRIFFTLTMKNMSNARFENKNHDFPTMIEYRRSGGHFLEVTIKNEERTAPPIRMHKIES